MNGGYKILNLNAADFIINGDAVVVPGSYEAIEGSYNKPIMLENFKLSGIEKRARYTNFGLSDGNYVSEIGFNADISAALLIKVTADDEVSFYEG